MLRGVETAIPTRCDEMIPVHASVIKEDVQIPVVFQTFMPFRIQMSALKEENRTQEMLQSVL
jgi:hypothetical protein